MSQCTLCARHAHDIGSECVKECRVREADLGQACTGCRDRIDRSLSESLKTYAQTEAPGFPTVTFGTGGGSSTAPLPGGTEWMNYRARVLPLLGTWAHDWRERFDLAGPSDGSLSSVIGWLRAQLDRACREHPALAKFADAVRDLEREGEHVAGIDRATGQRVCCPTLDEGTPCGARISIDVNQPDEATRCRRCGTEWTYARLRRISLDAAGETWLDPEAAARLVGISEPTLRRWARAGKIERAGGRYLLQSIRAAAAG